MPLFCVAPPANSFATARELTKKNIDESPIFIFTTGRSGSTLLQRILNSNNQLYICGEHGDFLKSIAKSYYQICEDPLIKKFILDKTKSSSNPREIYKINIKKQQFIAWENFWNLADVNINFRHLITNFFRVEEGVRWGFKAITYGDNDRVIEMLYDLFPKCKIIFLIRNPIDTLISTLLAFHRQLINDTLSRELNSDDKARLVGAMPPILTKWSKLNSKFFELHNNLGCDNSRILKYEDIISENRFKIFTDIQQFLDLSDGFNIKEVLGNKVDSTNNIENSHFRKILLSIISEERDIIYPIISRTLSQYGYNFNKKIKW